MLCLIVAGSNSNDTLSTCCSSGQVISLTQQMALSAAMLARCPSCLSNFRTTFCYLTCGPHQSDYMTVTGTANATDTSE